MSAPSAGRLESTPELQEDVRWREAFQFASAARLGVLTLYNHACLQAMNPQTRPYLDQPDFQAMMRDMGNNPGNMNRFLADERFQNALQVNACCGL